MMLLQALPLAAALFVLFPRINGPLWGLPGDAHSASTGMSDTMSPGQISDLANNDEVAFRVQFEGLAPAQSQMYWRGPTLGHFDGKVWRAVRADVVPRPAAQATLPEGGKALHYRSTLEPHSGRWLFALDLPASVPSAPDLAVSVSPDFDMLATDRVATRTRFDATARLDASIGLNETPLSLQNWLQLPPGHHRRTLELASRWRNEEADNGALVKRTLSMFETQFKQSVEEMLSEYPTLVTAAAFQLGALFNRNDYPDVESITGKFRFSYVFMPVPTAGDFRIQAADDAIAELQAQAEEHMNKRVNDAMKDIWTRLHECLSHMSDKLGDLPTPRVLKDGTEVHSQVFRDSLVNNAVELCGLLTKLNVTDDPNLEQARHKLESAITGVTAEGLRSDDGERDHLKKQVDDILKAFAF
jgi:hypothetical protein